MNSVVDLNEGEIGEIVSLQGVGGFLNKLDAMGIRIGVTIEKVSSQFMRGPVCIKIGNTEVAIGYGMAKKIIVKKAGE